jgi:hypothetical protein
VNRRHWYPRSKRFGTQRNRRRRQHTRSRPPVSRCGGELSAAAQAALVAFVLSRIVGRFGFSERGWVLAPHAAIGRRGELLVEVLRDNSRRFEMNPLLVVYFSVGTSFAGVALLKLQARLELWAYQRHAED